MSVEKFQAGVGEAGSIVLGAKMAAIGSKYYNAEAFEKICFEVGKSFVSAIANQPGALALMEAKLAKANDTNYNKYELEAEPRKPQSHEMQND